MTKRIRKIGIAARLTAVVAVILAVFVGLWTFKLIENAQVVAAYRAGMEVNDICWRVEHTLVEKGYDPDDMPSANTPEYDKMRCDLAYSIWDSEKAYVVQYYDGQENWVTMRSPLLLYGKNADADIDISNFAEQDIREMREVYGPKKGFSDDVGYIAMIYGKKIENNGHTIYIPNRICVGAYDYEWTAQTPVEEVGQWEEMPQWCFDKDSNMEVYFAEKKYLETKLRCINGENVKVDHTGGYFTIFLSLSSTIGYGHGMVMATAPIDKEAAYEDLFWGMPFITIALYLIFLFIFYKIVRRMVADPLVDTAREANLVANLAFDEFKPDLKRGDEIGELNRALSEMASTLHARWDSERDLEDKRQQFVSAASHDLKTPLTAIITYVDLLKDPALSAEDRAKYIETLDKKSQRLKRLIEDLFEVSKAATRNVAMHYAEVDLAALLKQVQYELADKTEASGIDFRWQLPEERMPLVLDGQKTCRIFENLVVNITKYGMPGTRAYITLMPQEHGAQVVFKNISATELDFSAEEITDRFVRGDRSRNTEGSGLGLAIAKSFAELQGGTFSITVDGDLFKATVTLPDTNQPEQPETLPLPAAPDADAQSAPQTGGALPAGI